MVEYTIGVFKNHFRYFKAGKCYLPLNTQVDIVYALAVVYNFININNLDDLLDNNLEVEDKVIDKNNTGLTKVESNIVMN